MKIKYLNYSLALVAIVGSLYIIFTHDQSVGILLKDLSIILTMPLLYWIELIFKVKIDDRLKFVYMLFVFSAQFLGVTVELYNSFDYYDKINHTLSGMLSAYGGLLILSLMDNNKHKGFNILWMVCFSLAIAAGWEMFEYSANLIFGGDAQRVALTGVNDTMLDIIVAFLGSLLVSLFYGFYSKLSVFDFTNSIKRID